MTLYNGYTPTTKWEQLPRETREMVRVYKDWQRTHHDLHMDACPWRMDDPGDHSCNCGYHDLEDKLMEHGYTENDIERLFA